MTTSTVAPELSVVDTNVLVYAIDAESEHHQDARAVLIRAADENAGLCVTPQILAELFAVVTSARRVRAPKAPADAVSVIEHILMLPGISLLPIPADVVPRWIDLVRRYPVTGQKVFDLQLVATLLGNGVKRIYTFNRSDFEPFSDLQILVPPQE